MTNIYITITGCTGSGKTTLKEVISKCLQDIGLHVEVEAEDDDGIEHRVATDIYVRAMVKKGHKVTIRTRALRAPMMRE